MVKSRSGRAPDTPPKRDDSDTADLSDVDTQPLDEIPVGRRFTSSDDLLAVESEMIAEGIELANRAIPLSDHPEHHNYDSADEIREEIEAELSRDHPNKQRIGVLNELVATFDT